MKIICEKEKLLKGINSVINGVASKTTMPILEGILIQTNDKEVKLTTYDLEIGIEYIIECDVKDQGNTVVNATMFSEIIRKLPDTEITISINENNLLEIECEGSLYKLATMNPEEFPELPKINIDNSIEIEQKKKLEEEARAYFTEYIESKKIDFVTFEKIGLKIGASDNPTKLKKQITAFVDKLVDDLNLIETQEHKAEILVEYKQSLNVSQAITTVTNRFKAIEEEKKKQEEKVVHIEMNQNHEISKRTHEELEDVFSKPLEQPKEEKEEILTLKFTVKGTRTKLRELKDFLENGGYDYE